MVSACHCRPYIYGKCDRELPGLILLVEKKPMVITENQVYRFGILDPVICDTSGLVSC